MSAADDVRHDANKDPDTLVREIEATRADVGDTLDALQAKLSPGQMLDQALGLVREHGGEFARNLGTTAKQNPIPLILTGVGLVWMMASQSSSGREPRGHAYAAGGRRDFSGSEYGTAEYGLDTDESAFGAEGSWSGEESSAPGMGERLRHTAESARAGLESARSGLSRVRHRASGGASALYEGAGHMSESARHQMYRARESFSSLVEEQPLLLGVLGLALGAAVGAMLPETEAEDRLLGEKRDEALRRARELGEQQYANVRETVQHAAEGAREAVSESNGGRADETAGVQPRGGAPMGGASPYPPGGGGGGYS